MRPKVEDPRSGLKILKIRQRLKAMSLPTAWCANGVHGAPWLKAMSLPTAESAPTAYMLRCGVRACAKGRTQISQMRHGLRKGMTHLHTSLSVNEQENDSPLKAEGQTAPGA